MSCSSALYDLRFRLLEPKTTEQNQQQTAGPNQQGWTQPTGLWLLLLRRGCGLLSSPAIGNDRCIRDNAALFIGTRPFKFLI